MDNRERMLELEARIAALEFIVKHTLWNVIVARVDDDGGDDKDAIDEARSLSVEVADALALATFPSADPALSDHLSAVSRDHALRVLRELVSEMEASLGAH